MIKPFTNEELARFLEFCQAQREATETLHSCCSDVIRDYAGMELRLAGKNRCLVFNDYLRKARLME